MKLLVLEKEMWIFSEKIDDLNPPLTKEQQAYQAKRNAFLDEFNALDAKLNAKVAAKKNDEEILVNKKSLFPPWSFEKIEEAIINPKLYWLEPQTSFSAENDVDCQMDLPIMEKAFHFCSLESIQKISMGNTTVDRKLFNFYVKHSKVKYKSWNIKKIVVLKVGKSERLIIS